MAVAFSYDDPRAQEILKRADERCRRVKTFRQQYDQRRLYFYRQYLGQRDPLFYPDNVTPRSNSFFNYPFSNVETVVAKAYRTLFPNSNWFEVSGKGTSDAGAAEKMDAVQKYMMHKAGFACTVQDLIRTIAIYGHGALKVDWDWEQDVVNYKQAILVDVGGNKFIEPAVVGTNEFNQQIIGNPQTGLPAELNPQTGQPLIADVQVAQKQIARMCPKFQAIDPYDLLIDPDGQVVVHMVEYTLAQLLAINATNPELFYPEALETLQTKILAQSKEPSEVILRIAEIWDSLDKTCTQIVYGKDQDAIRWKDARAAFRGVNYSYYRSREVYGGDPVLLWHGPNQFAHQRVPIVHTSYVKLPNEVYGIGVIEPIAELTESLNKFSNMIVDNWNLGINRRYAYDINADIDHEQLRFVNVPGGMVGVNGDPTKVLQELPFMTPTAGDYQLLGIYKGVIEMVSGISDFYAKGIGSPTNNDTATGITSVIAEADQKFGLFIANIVRDILTPTLEMVGSMIQQNVTDELEMQITDELPAIPKYAVAKPEELIGNFNYDFAASYYSSNKLIRQRTLLEFMNIAGGSPYWNQYEALRVLAKLYDIPERKMLLYTPEQVAQMQAQQKAEAIDMMILEHMLNVEGAARTSQAKPQAGKDGRPKTSPGGDLPGAGLTSTIRNFAQSMGSNVLGTSGFGEGALGAK